MWHLASEFNRQFIERGIWGLTLTIALLTWRSVRDWTGKRLGKSARG